MKDLNYLKMTLKNKNMNFYQMKIGKLLRI
jgi:hypothetical protein